MMDAFGFSISCVLVVFISEFFEFTVKLLTACMRDERVMDELCQLLLVFLGFGWFVLVRNLIENCPEI